MARQQQQASPGPGPGDRWKTYTVQCKGGLNTSQDTLSYQPGEATQLINFEPSTYGGYRRISGFDKYDTNSVPGTGNVLGVCVWNGTGGPGIIACRQNDVYFGTGAGWNTKLTGGIAAPAQPVLSQSAAGTLAATTYFVKITYTNAQGETTVSPEANLAVSANNVLGVASPAAENGATGWNVYVSTSTGTETKQNGATPIAIGTNWTEPASGLVAGAAMPNSNTATVPRTDAGRYMFAKYYYSGKKIAVMCDGVNPAGRWDGTTYTQINGTGAPTNPKFATFFAGCLVLAGYTSGGGQDAFSISAGSSDTDFIGTDGALEIKVGDTITGIRAFRETLYIFCQRSIYSFGLTSASTSNTPAQMSIQSVATGIGCVCYDSIQEVNGDLVYLAEDGIRTLAGTMKLNDVELGTISKPILNTANQVDHLIGGDPDNVSSVVIREKNQYRLFYNTPGEPEANAQGILGAIRPGKQTMTQFGTYISFWEWATLQGIKPVCCDSDLTGTTEIVVHGGTDGYVYQQEVDGAFNGSNVTAVYTTAPLQFDDPEIRKLLQKITVYTHPEGTMNLNTQVIYDFSDTNTMQPPVQVLSAIGTGSTYGNATYGTSTYGGQTTPKITANVVGSGKIIQISFTTTDTNLPYSIQGISFSYRPLGRR